MNFIQEIRAFRERLRLNPILSALVSLVANSTVYLAGGLLVGLGNIVLLPLYTRTLAPREFGIYALLDVTILLIVAVSLLKIDVSYLKWFADLDASRHGELLGSSLFATLIISAVIGLVLMLCATGRIGEAWLHTSTRSYAWTLCPIVVSESLQALFLTDLRARRRPVPYVVGASLRLASMIVASYYLLVHQGARLNGLFLGRLVGDAVAIAFLLGVTLPNVARRFSPSLLGPMLRFGLPLIWGVFAVMLQEASGRFFLSRYGTLEEVGYLGAAIKIGAVFVVLLGQPFSVAWGGVMFQIIKGRDAQAIYSKIFAYIYALALSTAFILSVFAPTLFRVFTSPVYYPAIVILPLVLLTRAMSTIEQPAAAAIYLVGRTNIFAGIQTVALVVNLLLTYELVPRYGAIGAVWAWFLGSALLPVADLVIGQRFYPLRFKLKGLLLPVVPWVLIFFGRRITNWNAVASQLWVQILVGSFVAVLTIIFLLYDLRLVRSELAARAGSSQLTQPIPGPRGSLPA